MTLVDKYASLLCSSCRSDISVVDPRTLRHRCVHWFHTAPTDPLKRDSELDLPGDLPVWRLRNVGSAGAVQPKTTRVTLQSLLTSGNATKTFRTRILLHRYFHRWRRLQAATGAGLVKCSGIYSHRRGGLSSSTATCQSNLNTTRLNVLSSHN